MYQWKQRRQLILFLFSLGNLSDHITSLQMRIGDHRSYGTERNSHKKYTKKIQRLIEDGSKEIVHMMHMQ